MDVALIYGAALLLGRSDWPSFLVSQFALAIVLFNAFSILHECGHGAASKHRWLNTLVGHLASTFCFIPYFPWKYIHQKHHAWAGNLERDPVLKSIRTWRKAGVPWVVRMAWWSWIPLGALLQHVVYMAYPLTMWRAGELTRPKLLRSALSIAWLPLSWWMLWSLAPGLARASNFLLAIGLFLVAEELVNAPHHVGMPTFEGKLPIWEQHRATRSCYYPRGVSELLVLNFNFHIEHHLFPNLPWFRLRGARRLLREALGTRYQEAVGIAWNLQNRRCDLQTIVDRHRVSTVDPRLE